MSMFATFVAFVSGCVFLTEAVNRMFKVSGGTAKLVVSWVVSLAMAAVGFWLQLGFLADCGAVGEWQGWVKALLVGVGCALCSNGLYDRSEIWELLEKIFSIFRKKQA